MMILLKLVIVLHWGGSTKILVWSISPLPLPLKKPVLIGLIPHESTELMVYAEN